MKKPMGTPTPVPILDAVGRPEDVSEGLSLGPELGGAELMDLRTILVTSEEVVVGPIPKILSVPSEYTVPGAGFVDEEIVILAVAAGTLEGESVPHGLQPPDP